MRMEEVVALPMFSILSEKYMLSMHPAASMSTESGTHSMEPF